MHLHERESDDTKTPAPVAAYLAAEKAKEAAALSRCFVEDGSVHDEGHDYCGHDAIREWKLAADAKYRYVMEPIDVQADRDEVTVRAQVTGEFPGSPVELDLNLKLFNNKIVSLEI